MQDRRRGRARCVRDPLPRPGRSPAEGWPAPWYLLTNEPVATNDELWRIVLAHARRWELEMVWRSGKSELAMVSARVWSSERRKKLLLLASLAYAFLVSLLHRSCDLLRARLLPHWCHRTGKRTRETSSASPSYLRCPPDIQGPRYRVRWLRLSLSGGTLSPLSASWPYLRIPKGCYRMKRIPSPILLLLVMAALLSPRTTVTATSAATTPVATRAIVTFQLHVSGDIPQEMTFWIAYGPLAGHFGIVRLHRADTGLYTASMCLPVGRSSFAYVAGYGVIRVRYGPVPGDPVITIRCLDRSTARQAARRVVYWHVPIG